MSIWKATPVEQVPHITMRNWKVYEVSSESWAEKTRHFVGYNVTEREGRVSSPIVEFDSKTMRGRTKSGRVYQLTGNSSLDRDAEYTWAHWRTVNHVTEVEEIRIENA